MDVYQYARGLNEFLAGSTSLPSRWCGLEAAPSTTSSRRAARRPTVRAITSCLARLLRSGLTYVFHY